MGASDDDVDAKSATELQFKRDFFSKAVAKRCEDLRVRLRGKSGHEADSIAGAPPDWHERGETRVIPFDIDDFLEIDKQCTSPNLMASFYSRYRRLEENEGKRDESSVLRHSWYGYRRANTGR